MELHIVVILRGGSRLYNLVLNPPPPNTIEVGFFVLTARTGHCVPDVQTIGMKKHPESGIGDLHLRVSARGSLPAESCQGPVSCEWHPCE